MSEPAFPSIWANTGDMNATAPDGQLVPPGGAARMMGATLRDYFAAKAMAGWLAGYPADSTIKWESVAKIAYLVADAMLEARRE